LVRRRVFARELAREAIEAAFTAASMD
jgi:hypothetical protein